MNNQNFVVVDADDFCEENHSLDLVRSLKSQIPKFKITMFTIPGRCTFPWLRMIRDRFPYIEMVPHGWMHEHSRECQNWTIEAMKEYLDRIEPLGMVHGWKAPGWQISDGSYSVLVDRDYWIADQSYNSHRRPIGSRIYELDAPWKIHSHIGHMGGHNANALEIIAPQILAAAEHDTDFRFISEVME